MSFCLRAGNGEIIPRFLYHRKSLWYKKPSRQDVHSREWKNRRLRMEKKLHLPKAVIFDMDGVLIDTEKYLVRYWCQADRKSVV